MRSLLPGRSTSIELTPAAFSALGQRFFEFQIFVQQLRVVLLREPARAPSLRHAQAESVRMYFLTHGYSFSVSAACSLTFTTMCDVRR